MTESLATKGYRIELYQDPDDDGWAAEVPDLPGCVAAGVSPADAITAAIDAIEAWIHTATTLGRAVPPPFRRTEEHSGRFVLRVPRGLHGRLAREAEREGVSLNSYCATVLAEAVGASSQAGSRRQLAIARVSTQLAVEP
jgi:predicted RNase H-like HicB family nuclease